MILNYLNSCIQDITCLAHLYVYQAYYKWKNNKYIIMFYFDTRSFIEDKFCKNV